MARYAYDVAGRRIVKRVYRSPFVGAGARYQRYVYHGDQVAFETDSAGTITSKYSWAPGTDNLLGFTDSTGTYYNVVADHLGSVRGLVRRDSAWIMYQRFTPYGTRLSRDSSGTGALPTLRYGWTGREHDAETGLVYFRARYYDPGQRRFTQEDPIGFSGGANLYSYVGGQVLSARDPSGMVLICVDKIKTSWLEDERYPGVRINPTTEVLSTTCWDTQVFPGGVASGPGRAGAGAVGGAGPGWEGQPPNPEPQACDPPRPDCGEPGDAADDENCVAVAADAALDAVLAWIGAGLAKKAANMGEAAWKAATRARYAARNGRPGAAVGEGILGVVKSGQRAEFEAAGLFADGAGPAIGTVMNGYGWSDAVKDGIGLLSNGPPGAVAITLIGAWDTYKCYSK